MKWVVLLLLFVSCTTSVDILQVPEPVMDFILGCERAYRSPKLPISRSTLDTPQEESAPELMDMSSLKASLHDSFDDGEVVNHIVSEIEKSLKQQEASFRSRQGCINVAIENPPQVNENLSGQLQAVISQENRVLMQQFNTLMTFKMNTLLNDIKALLSSGAIPDSVKVETVVPQETPVDSSATDPSEPNVPPPADTNVPLAAALEADPEPVVKRIPEEILPDSPLIAEPIVPENIRSEDIDGVKSEEPAKQALVPLVRKLDRSSLRRQQRPVSAPPAVAEETEQEATEEEEPKSDASKDRFRRIFEARRRRYRIRKEN